MWQGQVKGNKTWSLAPTPECDSRCKPFQFYVEPGDAGKRRVAYTFVLCKLNNVSREHYASLMLHNGFYGRNIRLFIV